MKQWIVPVGSLSAIAGVAVLALFLAGVFDNDDADGNGSPEVAGVCAEDTPNCDDTLVAQDGGNDDEDSGDTSAPVCAPGVTDCVDTVVIDNKDVDSADTDDLTISPVCAPGYPDCVDMIVSGSDGDLDDEPLADPIVPVDGERDAIDVVLTAAQTQFGVDDSEIAVESSAFQEWSNACLDAATEGEACAEIITPGFVVVIEIDGTQYEYHTDLNGNARLAP